MKKNSGFTLVELSIVIVIIALLVAGVLQGQALIEDAKMKRVVREHEDFIRAVNTFRNKYQAIPGDMPNATTYIDGAAGNGNGNSIIEHSPLWNGAGLADGEVLLFWQHLAIAKMIDGNYSGALSSGELAPSTNVPASAFNPAAGWVFYQYDSAFLPAAVTPMLGSKSGQFYQLGICSTNHGHSVNSCDGPVMTPKEAKIVDLKADDGIANTGNVLGINARNSDFTGYIAGCGGEPDDDPGSDYDLDVSDKACVITFWEPYF